MIRHQALLDNLIERGTQHVCLRTQWVDLIVIAGLSVTLFMLHLMRAKAHRGEPGWPRLAPWLAMLGPGIATADAWESLVTRTMPPCPLPTRAAPRLLRDAGVWFDRNRCMALCQPGTPR
ncbi:MAG: hypothetical protein ACK5UM_09060 [Pseudomonadota bacterium]|nr:hypothetical protein [Rubrivivax sp.]MCA3259596.1 hypothetical protein [Rubrivivax sp.]MCZ8030648.1 hypothetical protein [Rubrivivax sp.]